MDSCFTARLPRFDGNDLLWSHSAGPRRQRYAGSRAQVLPGTLGSAGLLQEPAQLKLFDS